MHQSMPACLAALPRARPVAYRVELDAEGLPPRDPKSIRTRDGTACIQSPFLGSASQA